MIDEPANNRVGSLVCLLSLTSCVSLLIFGLASFLLSLLFFEISGILIGAVLTFHGYFEFRQREQFIKTRGQRFASRLAWNQIGLAVSVGAYLLWRFLWIGSERLLSLLERSPIKELLEQWPPEMVTELKETLPRFVSFSYLLAAVVAIFGCLGMAALYRREGKRLAALSG